MIKEKINSIIIYWLKLAILYGFLLLGGLWNILGMYQYWMELLSGYVLIIVSLWAIYEHLKSTAKNLMIKQIVFFLFVIILTYIIELIGVKTGYPFGVYSYTDKLTPLLFGVPLSIGFAWAASMLASYGIISMFDSFHNAGNIPKALLTGILMMIFDIALEPAAIEQNFWFWEADTVPYSNYISWFVIGSAISYFGYKYQIIGTHVNIIHKHFFYAQILFFLMSGGLIF